MLLRITALTAALVLTGCAGNDAQQANAVLIDSLSKRVADLEAQQQALSQQVAAGGVNVVTGITAVPAQRRSGVYDDTPINAAAGIASPEPLANNTVNDGLDQGIALYRAGDIDSAIGFLTQYVSQGGNGDAARVNLARYWLGDAYYTKRQFEQANRYLGLYLREAPQGEKSAAALDKLINSLRAAGRGQDADILAQQGVQAIQPR